MSYLIMVLMGFMLIGIGTVGYFQSTVIKKTTTDRIYEVRDGNTGQILWANFDYNVSQDWKIVPREIKTPTQL